MQEIVKRLEKGMKHQYIDRFNKNLSVLTRIADDYVKNYEEGDLYPRFGFDEGSFKVIICRVAIAVANYIDWFYEGRNIESFRESEISHMLLYLASEEYVCDYASGFNDDGKEFLVAFGFCIDLEARLCSL